ncbi:MAG: 4-hydroxy-tetrahydrodipicolinate synthase [Candidatus Bathyarchaeia archaeon]
MKPSIELKGVIVPMLTPFKRNGELNMDALKMLTEHLIEQEINGLFPVSSIGEAAKLSMEEKKIIIKMVVDVANGRVPVIPGTGFPDEKRTIQLTRYARDVGADGVVIVEPYYQKPSFKALYQYYKRINRAVKNFPLLLYNIPSLAGYELTTKLVVSCADLDNIVGIKDSSGNLAEFTILLNTIGDKIAILQGLDILFFPSLMMGAPGGMLGGGNIAGKLEVEMYKACLRGEIKKAKSIHDRLVPLWNILGSYGTFPVPFKEALTLMRIPVGPARMPAEPLTNAQKKRLREVLIQIGLLAN